MFETEIRDIIEKNQVEITKKVVDSLKEKITQNISWAAEDILKEEVKKFVIENVLPDVRKELLEQRANIVAIFKESSVKIACAISDELQTKIVKNLSSWSGKEMLKKLLD